MVSKAFCTKGRGGVSGATAIGGEMMRRAHSLLPPPPGRSPPPASPQAEHVVAHVKQTGGVVAGDLIACLPECLEGNAVWVRPHRLVGPRRRIVHQLAAILRPVERGALLEHRLHPGGEGETKLLDQAGS